MKKTIATISAILVALTCLGQTIDYTGVSINTALGRMRYAILNLRKLAEEKNMLFQY